MHRKRRKLADVEKADALVGVLRDAKEDHDAQGTSELADTLANRSLQLIELMAESSQLLQAHALSSSGSRSGGSSGGSGGSGGDSNNRTKRGGKRSKQDKRVDQVMLAKELEAMPDLASTEHYQELSLWTQIATLNHALFASVDAIAEDVRSAVASSKVDSTLVGNRVLANGSWGEADDDAHSGEPFRDTFISQLTADFSDDLDKLRQVRSDGLLLCGWTLLPFLPSPCLHFRPRADICSSSTSCHATAMLDYA